MSWKTDLQLRDLDKDQRLELTCRSCGVVFFEEVCVLIVQEGFQHVWLDEVEKMLQCHQRGCDGAVRLAIDSDAETEGFSGGLA